MQGLMLSVVALWTAALFDLASHADGGKSGETSAAPLQDSVNPSAGPERRPLECERALQRSLAGSGALAREHL